MPRAFSRKPEPLPPPSRQRRWLFPARDAFHRRVLPREPATHPRLGRRVMSFRPAFTPARSRVPRLDHSCGAGSSPAARRPATCRSPTSAIETTREHDRRSPRTLPTPREVALAWSSLWQVALRVLRRFRFPDLLSQPSVSRARGRMRLAPRRGTSVGDRSLSGALPQPDRPGHPMSLARDADGRWCRRRQTP